MSPPSESRSLVPAGLFMKAHGEETQMDRAVRRATGGFGRRICIEAAGLDRYFEEFDRAQRSRHARIRRADLEGSTEGISMPVEHREWKFDELEVAAACEGAASGRAHSAIMVLSGPVQVRNTTPIPTADGSVAISVSDKPSLPIPSRTWCCRAGPHRGLLFHTSCRF